MKQILLGLVVGVTIIACIGATTIGTSISPPWNNGSGGGQILASTQFRTNSGVVYFKSGGPQTNGAFWSDGITFALKAIGNTNGSQDAFRQFEFTTDGSTGYKLFGNAVQKWALNSDGSGSGTGLLTVGSLATTGSTGTLLVSDSSVVVTNTSTGDNIVISTNGTITINGNAVSTNSSGGGLGYTLHVLSVNAASLTASSTFFLGDQPGVNAPDATSHFPIKVPKAGTIKAVSINFHNTALASAGSMSVYVTNYTKASATASTTTSMTSTYVRVYGSGLSGAVAAGDDLDVVLVTPAWVSAPTTAGAGNIYIE